MSTKRKSIESQTSGMKEDEFVKPDGGYGWVILIVAFLISFIVDGCMYSFGIVLVEIKNHFGVPQEIANLVQSLNVGFLFLSGTVLSGLASQFGVRPVVMIGATIFSLMYVVCSFVPAIYYMIVLFGFIGGVSFACTYNSLFIILVEYFHKKLGIANGMTMAGSGLGAFAFAPFAKYLVSTFGWKITMRTLGGLTFLCCGLGLLLRPIEYYKNKAKKNVLEMKKANDEQGGPESERLNQDGQQQQRVHFDESAASEKKESAKEIFMKIIREIFNFTLLKENKMLLMIVISNFFSFLCYFTPFTFIPIRAQNLNLEHYAWIISIIGICNIPFRVGFGFMADREILTAVDMNTLCIFIAACTMFAYYFLTTFIEQAIFGVIFAFAMAGLNCLTTNYVVEIVGHKAFANAFGILSIARGLGAMTGPYLTGIIYEKSGSEFYPFLTTGISFTIALVFTAIISINQFIQRQRSKRMMKNGEGREKAEAIET